MMHILQDWVGQRKTAIGSQLWWNWEVDDDHYAGWKDLIRDLRRDGVRTMAYCNPCLVPVRAVHPRSIRAPNFGEKSL